MKLVIIDYQISNIFSIRNIFSYLGYKTHITQSAKDIQQADAIVMPGVGAFGEAMIRLQELELIDPIKNFIQSGKPFLGICLGLQMLFSKSYEFGVHAGLGIIEGDVVKFSKDTIGQSLPIPQIGWNQIKKMQSQIKTPLTNLSNQFFYFLHSYYVKPTKSEYVLSTSQYGNLTYCSSIQKDNIFATQFHPEKSGLMGLTVLKNWIESSK